MLLELVYCVPNYAEVKKLRNKRQLKDKIGFVQRGEVLAFYFILKLSFFIDSIINQKLFTVNLGHIL